MKKHLKRGYIRTRNDEMCEYTIVGMDYVRKVLKKLLPNLYLKKQLAKAIIKLIDSWPKYGRPTLKEYLKFCRQVDATAVYNYSKKRTITTATVEKYLTKN